MIEETQITREVEDCPKNSETVIKIKLWGLIIVLIALFGSLMGVLYAKSGKQEIDIKSINERVIKIETIVPYINNNLDQISKDIRELKQMRQQK